MAAGLSACAALRPTLPEDPARELATVPFFPQTIHHCGPAALATVLNWSGVAATPENLASQVYIPGRRGSLAVELVAATRRAGRVPYRLAPEPAALFAEVESGTPVLVLQDLGVAWLRRWHFAVLVGYDAEGDLVVLRSGRDRRLIESRERFIETWERGGRWAMVAVQPGELPATVTTRDVVDTVEQSRPFLPADSATRTYETAVHRWPTDPMILFAAANEAYAHRDLAHAGTLYRRLLAADPRHVAGLNNLANLELDLGRRAEALRHARAALAELERADTSNEALKSNVSDTLRRAQTAAN